MFGSLQCMYVYVCMYRWRERERNRWREGRERGGEIAPVFIFNQESVEFQGFFFGVSIKLKEWKATALLTLRELWLDFWAPLPPLDYATFPFSEFSCNSRLFFSFFQCSFNFNSLIIM